MNYKWSLKDAKFTKDKGKVFSTFSCAGCNALGFELAGFDVIGNLEISPKFNRLFTLNLPVKYSYLEDIREFNKREDLPEELYNLDILEGCPPSVPFSSTRFGVNDGKGAMGQVYKGYEGIEQDWSTLFFDFLDMAEKLKPKVLLTEEVKGILFKRNEDYLNSLLKRYDEIGYHVEYHILDAKNMGIPQKRARVFFIAIRKDLYEQNLPKLDLEFNEPIITYGEFADYKGETLKETTQIGKMWPHRVETDRCLADITKRELNKNSGTMVRIIKEDEPLPAIFGGKNGYFLYSKPLRLSDSELLSGQAFPYDYNFDGINPWAVVGRGCPPVMFAKVAERIYDCWLKNLK